MTRDALDASLRPWTARARVLTCRRLADARAHAQGGSRDVALNRLDELHEVLRGHLADARTAFHRETWGSERPNDPLAGDRKAEHIARESRILGRDQYRYVRSAIEDAKAGLRSAMISGAEPRRLAHWEAAHGEAVTRTVEMSLSDAQMAIHSAVNAVLAQ